MRANVMLIGHGGSGNRGCEAILRCTCSCVKAAVPNASIVLLSHHPVEDEMPARELGVVVLQEQPFPLNLLPIRLCRAIYRGHGCHWYRSYDKKRKLNDADVVISIGGDNITPEYALRNVRRFVLDLSIAADLGKATVLWGATVGPFSDRAYRELTIPVLRKLDLIVVRDYESRDELAAEGLSENVMCALDPAFALPAARTARNAADIDWAGEQPCLGASVSGFLLHDESAKSRAHAFARILDAWIYDTNGRVLLVPHVTVGSNLSTNDYRFAGLVRSAVQRKQAVRIASARLSASEYKAIIGTCNVFMGTRMHASIAALSQLVPTLSLAYSRKAHALQQMLLGDDRYVCKLHGLDEANVTRKLAELTARDAHYRVTLENRLNVLKERQQVAIQALQKLCQDRSTT